MLGQVTLTAADFGVLAGIVTAIIGVPSGLVVLLLSSVRKDHCKLKEQCKADVHDIHQRIDRFETRKIEKVDYLREAVTLRRQLEALADRQAKLSGQIEQNMSMAAAMNRMAEVIAAALENTHGRG